MLTLSDECVCAEDRRMMYDDACVFVNVDVWVKRQKMTSFFVFFFEFFNRFGSGHHFALLVIIIQQ